MSGLHSRRRSRHSAQVPAHIRHIVRLRARIEDQIEALIALLDALDGDADFEPDCDAEDGGDAEPGEDDEPDADAELWVVAVSLDLPPHGVPIGH
jgi:hypothetical protein